MLLAMRDPNKAPRFGTRVLEAFQSHNLTAGLDVRAATASDPAEILLYDEIGPFGITGKDFRDALASAGAGPIVVRINSPGGSVFDGMAIHNAIAAHKGGSTVVVDGIAASIAAFIAVAAGRVEMGARSMMMIHNASGLVFGNRAALERAISALAKIDGEQAVAFAKKTGKPVADIAAMLDAETYMTAQEAVDAGFADAINEPASGAHDPTALGRHLAEQASANLHNLRTRLALAMIAGEAV